MRFLAPKSGNSTDGFFWTVRDSTATVAVTDELNVNK